MRVTPTTRRDEGFTLVEMLVAITVLVLIIGPLVTALVVYLRNTDQTMDRMALSHDAQITAAYFSQDVQSVGVRDWDQPTLPESASVELDAPATAGLYPCGAAGTPNALLRLVSNDLDAQAPQRVSYVVRTVGTERQLRRLTCDGSGTLTSDVVLAHNLAADPAPQVTCADVETDVPVSCTSLPLPPSAVFRLTLTLSTPSGDETLPVTLVGHRRQ